MYCSIRETRHAGPESSMCGIRHAGLGMQNSIAPLDMQNSDGRTKCVELGTCRACKPGLDVRKNRNPTCETWYAELDVRDWTCSTPVRSWNWTDTEGAASIVMDSHGAFLSRFVFLIRAAASPIIDKIIDESASGVFL